MVDLRQHSNPSHRASTPNSPLTRYVVVPTQDAESAQCVPAAGAADMGLHLQRNMFGMKEVQRPAPVLVTALDHDFDGFRARLGREGRPTAGDGFVVVQSRTPAANAFRMEFPDADHDRRRSRVALRAMEAIFSL